MKKNIVTVLAGVFAGLTLAACTAQASNVGPAVPEGIYPQTFVVTDVTATPDPTMERIGVETCTSSSPIPGTGSPGISAPALCST